MENSQSQQASTNPSISTSHVRKVYTNEDVVRIRPTTRKGDVWSNFDMCIMIDGVEKARCKKCMKFYNPVSNTTLRTHKYGCNAVSQNDMSQGTIGTDGQVFIFDNDAARLDFTKFVIQQALPFNHFDNVKITEIIKRRLQPHLSFGNKWRSWIRACLHSSRASILVNGSPTSELYIKRVSSNLIHGINLDSPDLTLSHLFYVDDVIITTKWNPCDLDNIIRVLHIFYLASRLKININKSNIYGIGVSDDQIKVFGFLFVVSVLRMEKENMKALLRVVTDCKGSDDTLLFKEQMLIQEMSTVEAISSNKRPRSLSLLSGKITPGARPGQPDFNLDADFKLLVPLSLALPTPEMITPPAPEIDQQFTPAIAT
ncbi:putative RNA-directed DNA polymerase, eukaryota, reverse transcriptase zinc-binding domain protein [Tanacetum coccineum]